MKQDDANLPIFRYNRCMSRNHLPILVILVLSLFIAAGCNLPSKSDNTFSEQQVAEISMEDLVKTAQAESPFIPEADGNTGTDDPNQLISRDHGVNQTEALSEPTPEPTATKDPNRQPPELPEIYVSDLLHQMDTPHEYQTDVCQVIKNRWGEGKAAPGTVVMAIMYHSIIRGEDTSSIEDPILRANTVTIDQHKQLIRNLHDQGFTAINTEQFIAFMENNDWIPERSVLDRKSVV